MLHFKQFGRYEIVSKLGRGMTDVYLALDTSDNRHTVLKIVEQSGDPWTQVVLEAERRGTLIQKQLHDVDPRFLEIYDSGEMNGCYYVAMQYVEGKTVAETLQAEKRMDPMRGRPVRGRSLRPTGKAAFFSNRDRRTETGGGAWRY